MHDREFSAGIPFGPATERAREILLEKDRQLLREIHAQGGMEKYVESHPDLKDAFTDEKRDLCCMDERTAKGTLNVPGSGILLEGEEQKRAYLERLHEAGVQGVYSHDGCGAAKLFAKKQGIVDYIEGFRIPQSEEVISEVAAS